MKYYWFVTLNIKWNNMYEPITNKQWPFQVPKLEVPSIYQAYYGTVYTSILES